MRICLILFLSILLGACANVPTASDHESPAPAASVAAALPSPVDAEMAYARADWPRAELLYLDLLEAGTDDPEAWFRLATAQAMLGRHEAAILTLREALKRAPGRTDGWYNLGLLRLRMAVSDFNEAARLADDARDDTTAAESRRLAGGILRLIDAGLATDAP